MPRGMHYSIATLIMLSCLTSTLARFINTPTSVNATLGSTATFNCSATTGVVAWILNGSLLSELSAADITAKQVENIFVLHVPATEEYNNTVVQCVLAILGGEDLYSDPVVLKVQGLLDAVSNLESESLGHVIRLTWDAPFSLDITGVDPDIWYHVDITVNKDSFNTSSDTIPFNTHLVNISQFNFMNNGTNTSVIYEFRVTPVNGAGNGTTSTPVTGYFIGAPKSVAAEKVVVEVSVEPLSVNFTITYENIPPGEMPSRFQVHAMTTDGGDKVSYCSDDIPVTPDSDGMVFIQLDASTRAPNSSNLTAYRDYTAWIVTKNDFEESKSTGEIPFSTHNVQSCEANNCSRPGTVNITCNFTENSNAKGYLSVLCPKDNSSKEMFVVANRADTSDSPLKVTVPGLPKSSFDVVVFDLGGDGLPPNDINYAAEEEENVTVIKKGKTEDDEVVSVNGTFLEVPNTTNAEVELCVSFGSSANTDGTVVLAHRQGDPRKLLRYTLNAINCTTAPPAGDYIVGVFTQTRSNVLREPATTPTFSFSMIPNISPVPSVLPTTAEIDPTTASLVGVAITVPVAVLATGALIGIVVLVRSRAKKASERITSRSAFSAHWKKHQQEEEMRTRIVSDSGTNPTPTSSCQPAAKPPLHYASLDTPVAPNSVPPIDMNVPYSLIEHDRKANQPTGIHYADLGELPGIPKAPPTLDDRVQYQTIKPPAQVEDPSPPLPVKRHVTVHPPSTPVNLENLFDVLHPAVIPKWQQLAEVLGVDEDLIDEIFTNNNWIDEECLKDILEIWLKKSSPTWKGVADVAQKIGEDQLAESLYHKHMLPGRVEMPRMTQSIEKLSLAAEEVCSGLPQLKADYSYSTVPRIYGGKQTESKGMARGQDNTLCTPTKSPEVDEVAFQEPSPANHSSPEGKLIDGKEVPLAENGGVFCESTPPSALATVPQAKHDKTKNDTFAGGSEDAKEEKEKERNPSHLVIRHAQKTMSKKTGEFRTSPDPVTFSVHMSREEVLFSEGKKEHILDEADGCDEAADHNTGTACFTSELLYSHVMRMWSRRQMPLLTDGYVPPTSSATFCYSMPLREVARTRTSQSESLGYNKTSIHLSPVECISEEEKTLTNEVVGPEIKLGITVQDKDVEETSLDDESIPCGGEAKVPQEGDVAVNKDPDMTADNPCAEPHQGDTAVDNPHKEPHQGDTAVDNPRKEPHQGDTAVDTPHKDPHQGDTAVDNPRKEPHQGNTAVDNPRKEPHQGNTAVDNPRKEPHQGDTAVDNPRKEPHQGNTAVDNPRKEPHQGDTAVDNPRKEPHQGDTAVDNPRKEPHQGDMAADKDQRDPCHKDLDQTNMALDKDHKIHGVVDKDPCPRDVGVVDRDCKHLCQGDVVVANKDHKNLLRGDTVVTDKNNRHLHLENIAVLPNVKNQCPRSMNESASTCFRELCQSIIKKTHFWHPMKMKIHSRDMWQSIGYFRELFNTDYEHQLWRDMVVNTPINNKLLQQDVDENLSVPVLLFRRFVYHYLPSLIVLIP